MKHISIEGMDGVGKSTLCKKLALRLGYKFVEKPLHYILDKNENDVSEYQRVAKIINADLDRNFTAWYYGLNNLYLYDRFKDTNIVTDRHIVSNYCWSGTNYNMDIYDLILKKIGKPTITIILYANSETIKNRLISRDPHDSDLKKIELFENGYKKMIEFCKLKELPYIIIDSANKSPDELVDEVIEKIGGLINE